MRILKECNCCKLTFHFTECDWVHLDFAGRVSYYLCPDCGRAIERLLFGRIDD